MPFSKGWIIGPSILGILLLASWNAVILTEIFPKKNKVAARIFLPLIISLLVIIFFSDNLRDAFYIYGLAEILAVLFGFGGATIILVIFSEEHKIYNRKHGFSKFDLTAFLIGIICMAWFVMIEFFGCVIFVEIMNFRVSWVGHIMWLLIQVPIIFNRFYYSEYVSADMS
ncbi:MAG: hypothetical protein Q8P90_01975 [bacterium]|nr:hypothetical protein [bacterium]